MASCVDSNAGDGAELQQVKQKLPGALYLGHIHKCVASVSLLKSCAKCVLVGRCMCMLLSLSWEEGSWLSTDSQRSHDLPEVKYY